MEFRGPDNGATDKSPALASPLRLIVILRIKVDTSEVREDPLLTMPLDIFQKSRRDRLFLGFVLAHPSRVLDQAVVNGQIRLHGSGITHENLQRKV